MVISSKGYPNRVALFLFIRSVSRQGDMNNPKKSCRITVRGVVQGVGFRYHTRRIAHSLGISGWVKNMDDGSVLIADEGAPYAMERFINWLYEGPPRARVSQVEVKEAPKLENFEGFETRF